MLKKEQLAYFDTFGFLFLRQAFSAEEMAELRSQQDRYFKFLARTGYA